MNTPQDKTATLTEESLMNYRVALAMVDHLVKEGLLTDTDKEKLYTTLAQKYGLDSGSIFRA